MCTCLVCTHVPCTHPTCTHRTCFKVFRSDQKISQVGLGGTGTIALHITSTGTGTAVYRSGVHTCAASPRAGEDRHAAKKVKDLQETQSQVRHLDGGTEGPHGDGAVVRRDAEEDGHPWSRTRPSTVCGTSWWRSRSRRPRKSSTSHF